MAPIRVTWAPTKTDTLYVRISYPNNLVEVVPLDDLFESLPYRCEVHGYYRDGPVLLGRLVNLRDRGYISRIVLRPYLGSHPYVRTEISGTAELTAKLWYDRSPEALVAHPVFERMCPYLPFGLTAAVADLIVTVFDPRWYADPYHPNRWSRLEQAFALSPRGDRLSSTRRAVIRGCWAAPEEAPGVNNVAADFYGRHHARLLAAGVSEEAAVRKTGRKLIKAVVAAWLDRESGGDPLFDPARLFDAAAIDAAKT